VLSIASSLSQIGYIENLSDRLNSADSRGQSLFNEVYNWFPQRLTWQSWSFAHGYVDTLTAITRDSYWSSADIITVLEHVDDIRTGLLIMPRLL